MLWCKTPQSTTQITSAIYGSYGVVLERALKCFLRVPLTSFLTQRVIHFEACQYQF